MFWISAYPITIIAHCCLKTITHSERNFLTLVELIYFPDTRVRGKHSAWQSTAPNRAEARIHHPQKNGSQKPSSGRKGDRDSGGRSLRKFKFARFIVTHSPSVACGDNSLSEGAFRKFTSIEKHHQRKFLGGVRVFSAKVAEASRCFFYYFTSSEPVVISLPDERLNIIISSPVISKRTF